MPHGQKTAEQWSKSEAKQGPQSMDGLMHGIGGQDIAAGKQKHVERIAEYGSEPSVGQDVMGGETISTPKAEGRGGNVDYGDSSTSGDMGPRIEKV